MKSKTEKTTNIPGIIPLNQKIVSLDFDEFDIEELERRLEFAAAWCIVNIDCGQLTCGQDN